MRTLTTSTWVLNMTELALVSTKSVKSSPRITEKGLLGIEVR